MSASIIRIEGVSKRYRTVGGHFGGGRAEVHEVKDVSLEIRAGQAFGLVGESGSGKSTLARMVMGLETATSGHIEVDGIRLPVHNRGDAMVLRKTIQIVFQDPYAALDPMMKIGASIEEPLVNLTVMEAAGRRVMALSLLHDVGLPERVYDAYPFQLSGGERQRVCIARALAPRPRIVVCDEPVSSLDKSIQKQVIDLLESLRRKHGLTYFFISHDLAVINRLCDEVAVMYRGSVIEQGARDQVLFRPRQDYTRRLVDAARYFQEGIPRLSA
ncbi:MAG: ABC transporter ATP-binding protein [Gammaproteobacteria bacterium]|nr:ABC transporter ATP-binding protein [Gammaproteobacteria bacterium]